MMNTTNMVMAKVMSTEMKLPIRMAFSTVLPLASVVVPSTILMLDRSTPDSNWPMIGLIKSLTIEFTTCVVAAPMMTPIARAMAFDLVRNL